MGASRKGGTGWLHWTPSDAVAAEVEDGDVGGFANVVKKLVDPEAGLAFAFGEVDGEVEGEFDDAEDDGTGDEPDGAGMDE